MILVDANLLLYAYDSTAPQHEPARRWLQGVFSSPEPIGLPWVSILAFLRISTQPRILTEPLLMAEAVSLVNEWLAQPNVTILAAGQRHWEILTELLAESQSRGLLVTDAHLAALAIEHGATLCTADRDFRRFSGLPSSPYIHPITLTSPPSRGASTPRASPSPRATGPAPPPAAPT